jgi:SOS-response transcriptional repressor LexA
MAKRTNSNIKDLQPQNRDFFDIPLLGRVRPNDKSHLKRDYNLSDLIKNFKKSDLKSITLEVLDDAMQKAGILKGDFLTVKLDLKPQNGDLAVVKLGTKIFLRKFYRQNHLIRLETANDSVVPLVVDEKTPGFEIIGKVISISRQL